SDRRLITCIVASHVTACPFGPPTVSSTNAHMDSAANAAMPSANSHCNGRRGRPASAAVASARLLTAANVGTSICIDINPGLDEPSIELAQGASSVCELGELALGARRRGESFSCSLFVA